MISVGSVLSLLAALILGITVTVSLSDSSGERIGPCKYRFRDNGTVIDLNPLASHDSSNWKFQAPDTSTNFVYYFSPCWPMDNLKSQAAECDGTVACQELTISNPPEFFNLGTPTTEAFRMDGEDVIVSYSGTTDGKLRTSEITLECNPSSTKFSFISQSPPPQPVYKFTLSAKECCPVIEGGGLSLGSILCIIFIVVLVVYIVGGILINKFARGATGVEVIPNREFWVDLPSLIKYINSLLYGLPNRQIQRLQKVQNFAARVEGFQFTASKITGCFSRDSQYDQI